MAQARMRSGSAAAKGDGKVAENGAEALYRLGLDYSIGQGVPRDLVTAHKWLNLAASQGSRQARDIRAEVARDMTAGEIAEAQRQAREWVHGHHAH